MEQKKTAVQLGMRYEWKEPNTSRLRKPIEDIVAALPGANSVSGTVAQAASAAGDFEQHTEYSNVPDWLDAPSETASSYRLYMAQGPNSLDLSILAGGLNVGIRGEAALAKELRAQVEQFAAWLGLKATQMTPHVVAMRTSGFRRNGSDRLLEDVTAADWLNAVDLIRRWMAEVLTFTRGEERARESLATCIEKRFQTKPELPGVRDVIEF